ncbi:hypothetical protein D3C72_915300 [compost metagenome]
MKSILFHFRHHIGIFYALSMELLGFIIVPLIGISFFELSKSQVIPFDAREALGDIGAMIATFPFPIAIVSCWFFAISILGYSIN